MAQAPARQQQEPAHQQSAGGALTVFDGFAGLNTQPSRYGLKDPECAVMDGFFPAGASLARIIPDNGPLITFPSLSLVAFFDFANIASTPYAIVFLTDGSVYSMNTTTMAINQISAPGTIVNPGSGNVALTQWGAQYVLIVNKQSNGYFIWDGTTFYQAGDVIPGVDGPGPIASSVLVSGGSGYAVNDTGIVLGGINDATYIVTSVNMASLGTGYAANDTGTVNTGNGDATYIINTVDGLGGVTGMHITSPGTNYLTAQNVGTSVGGGQPGVGTGLTINITVSSAPGPITGFTLSSIGVVTGYTITAPGTLYNNGSNAATQDGGGQPGSGIGLTLNLTVSSATMPSGIGGTAIETWQSYVFIANGPVLIWSGPASVTDFSTANGGGSLTSNESSLRVRYVQLRQSNGYLYLFGDSSISYASGIQTTGSPPTTSFTLQNVDPEVGTPWPGTVDVLGSNIVFANAWGAHVSFGGRAAKVSPELDGIYNTVPNFGGQTPTAAKTILFGKRVWVLLLPVIDQITFLQTDKLFLWDEKKWCSTQQSAAVTFIQHQEIDSVLTAWGTDGVGMYRLFQNPTRALTKTIRSKFWAPGLLYAEIKTEGRFWGLVQFFSGGSETLNVSIDSEFGPSSKDVAISPPTVKWLNNAGQVVLWLNDAAQPVVWISSADAIVVLGPNSIGQQGALVGFTLTTNAADIGLISMATMAVPVQYRG